MLKKQVIAGAFTLWSLLALPGQGVSVRRVTPEQAATGQVSIVVEPASGTTINFADTGEIIYRVWLDDPSRLTVDFDGPVETGARVIHLRLVEGLSFDNLPSGSSTLLTIVTRDGPATKTYIFPITYGQTDAHLITIAPPAAVPAEVATRAVPAPVDLSAVQRGLAMILEESLIESAHPIVARIEQFIRESEAGTAQRVAAANAGLRWEVIEALSRKGRRDMILTER
jgi:hypothetical protein